MPEDLAAQIEPLNECIKAMGWPMLIVEGVEADDVIGTLAKQAERENMRCIISTGDKDIAQLVNRQVTLINTMTNERLDEAAVLGQVRRAAGAHASTIWRWSATRSDNIPGVDKVGPKTARKMAHPIRQAGQYCRARQRNQRRGRRKFAQRARLAEHSRAKCSR